MVRRPLNSSILPETSSFAPDRHLPFAVELEEHQFGEAGAVGHHDTPRLAVVGRRLDAHHLDRQRDDLAGLRLGDGRALAAIEVRLGEMEQQVDHAIAAGHLGDQRADRRTDAFQRGQRREQRCERIMFHGLTGVIAPLYDTAPMSEPESASHEGRRRRLLYRATHRGTYENDILLGGFVRRHIDAMHESELAALEAVLELPDNDLADWLTGRMPIPDEVDTPLLRRIRDEAADPPLPRSERPGGGAEDGTTLRSPILHRRARAQPMTPVFGAPEGWDAFLLARRRGEFSGPVLHVTRDDARMARLAEALAFVVPEAEVLRFPAWDCLPYDRVSPNPALVSERIATLARLLDKPTGPRIVLTTVNALVQRVPPRSAFAGASLELRVNGTVQPEKLARFLEANGYGRAGTVMEPGEYAMRGGIIDVFPAGEADPVRLDLFGDTIEFDPRVRSRRRSAAPTSAPAPDFAPGVRGAARPRRDLALPHRLARHVRPAGGRGPDLPVDLGRAAASRHGTLGAAVPRADGDAARLPARRLGQPRPPDG